jgi:hypothetical protein
MVADGLCEALLVGLALSAQKGPEARRLTTHNWLQVFYRFDSHPVERLPFGADGKKSEFVTITNVGGCARDLRLDSTSDLSSFRPPPEPRASAPRGPSSSPRLDDAEAAAVARCYTSATGTNATSHVQPDLSGMTRLAPVRDTSAKRGQAVDQGR